MGSPKRSSIPIEITLDGFGPHSSYMGCLRAIWRQLGQIGADKDYLLPYQQRLLSDVEDGLDEQAVSYLYDYWEYDLKGLMARGRGWQKDVPAKPRIDIDIEITSKDNLKVEWFPRVVYSSGYDHRAAGQNDFLRWSPWLHTNGSFSSRPSNELLFLHELGTARHTIVRSKSEFGPRKAFDAVLLLASARLVEQLKERLDRHFDVRMRTEIYVDFNGGQAWSWDDKPQMTSWSIEDPEERQAQLEVEELATLEQILGVNERTFRSLWEECARKKASGPAPSPANVSTNLAKRLRTMGHEVTKRETDRFMYLLERHRGGSATL